MSDEHGVELRPVPDVAEDAARETERIRELMHTLGVAAQVEPFGATAWPDGVTKGDIDVLVRVSAVSFDNAVCVLRSVMRVAQPQNWTDTFASFTDDSTTTSVGTQLVAVDSEDDRVFSRQRQMMADPDFRRRYDEVKRRAAHLGVEGYWRAKHEFWSQATAGGVAVRALAMPQSQGIPDGPSATRSSPPLSSTGSLTTLS